MSSYATPRAIAYSNVLPVGEPCTTTTRKFQPSNGSVFDPTSNIIRIPVSANAFLDVNNSYLKFTLTNSSGSNCRLDTSANSVIQRLSVYAGDNSQLLWIENYNVLHAILSDFTLGLDYRGSIGHVMQGYGEPVICNATSTAAVAGSIVATANILSNIDGNRYTVRIDNGGSYTFCIPLVGGIFSSERFIPLQAIKNGNLTIETQLAPLRDVLRVLESAAEANCNYAGPNANYTISNVEYVANLVTFSGEFNNRFNQLLNSVGVQIHAVSFRNSIFSIASTGAATVSIPIPIRCVSLKSIITCFRYENDLSSTDQRLPKIGGRVLPINIGTDTFSYQFRIGGITMPLAPIRVVPSQGGAEAYAELLKALNGGVSYVNRASGYVSAHNYLSRTRHNVFDVGNPSTSFMGDCGSFGQFCIGIDCENFNNEKMQSGLDLSSNSLPVYLEVSLNNPAAAAAAGANQTFGPLRVDSFAMFDQVITFMPDRVIVTE